MATVYLGLGSNLGNREVNLKNAIQELKARLKLMRASNIIETEPVGGPPQGKYLNAVVQGITSLSPEELLNTIKSIEQELGRVETVVNGPRLIDIDILLYDHLQIQTDQLTIPHPRMFEREFVMTPLKEIAPEEFIEKLIHL